MNDQHLDRKRTHDVKGKKVTFTFRAPESITPAFAKITSVVVAPFDENGNLVVAKLIKRGVDLPGGHTQVGDHSIEDTARRECAEEAFITLGALKIASFIESDYFGSAPEQLTYMVVVAATVGQLNPVVPNEESAGRDILSPDQFLQLYQGNAELMRDILHYARAAYAQLRPATGNSPAPPAL